LTPGMRPSRPQSPVRDFGSTLSPTHAMRPRSASNASTRSRSGSVRSVKESVVVYQTAGSGSLIDSDSSVRVV
jgi:hypothetical protein